jgi:hypothetical protein
MDNKVLFFSQISSVDADAQAFISATGITDATQQNAIKTLVADLKSSNLWNKMKAVYPMIGGTETTHKFNLKDPRDLDVAFRLIYSGSIEHSINGVKSLGGFLNTNLHPTTILGNSVHFSFYSKTNTAGNFRDMGAIQTRGYGLSSKWSNNVLYADGGYTFISYGMNTEPSTGLFVVDGSIINSLIKVSRNGNILSSVVNSTPVNITVPMYLLGWNNNGNAEVISSRQCAFSSIGNSLSNAENIAFYNAVQKYQTSLNRQV